MGSKIQTSVDQLMQLVKKYEKISFKEAAKELSVPISTIQEWVNILEEEKLIKVVYSFTTPYIIRQSFSETDKKARIKRFDQKKDNLSLKIDMTAKFFDDLDAEMESISKIVTDVETNMEDKLSHIGDDLKELAEAENQKRKIDAKIIDSKQRSLSKIQELERHMQKSESNFEKDFQTMKKEYDADIAILQKNKSFVEKMKLQEKQLQKKLTECDSLSKKIHTDMQKQTSEISHTTEHIETLRTQREKLLTQIQAEHDKLSEVLQKSKTFESSIESMQKDIYKKITEKTKIISEKQAGAKKLPKNIKILLEKKSKLQSIVSDLTHAQITAKHDIERLRHEAKLLQKHIGMRDVDAELQKIHNDIDEMQKQKTFLQKGLKDLYSVLKVKK